ncbi:MAG: hypothetical protein U0835_12315, partial [Isosphaeraceae bacterium]
TGAGNTFATGTFGTGISVSWQGVNDLSARPSNTNLRANVSNTNSSGFASYVVLNTLGDLTNRENRFAYQRFVNDIFPIGGVTGNGANGNGDGLPDDTNADAVHDLWPSLYYNMWNAARGNQPALLNVPGTFPWTNGPLSGSLNADNMAFPYVYPGAYSTPHSASAAVGWIHSPDPGNNQNTIALLNALNHNPIDIGDSLPLPTTTETWWGFPTWRETLHPVWTDPLVYPGTAPWQPVGLHARLNNQPNTLPADLLPPMTNTTFGNLNTPLRLIAQPNNDQAGSLLFASYPALAPNIDALWRQTWEDDLVLSGVRSFDVKAYDDAYAGYVDLGWGDDGRLWAPYLNAQQIQNWTPPYVGALNANGTIYDLFINGTNGGITPVASGLFMWPPQSGKQFGHYGTFAHEGRIPPILYDARPDYQFPGLTTNLGDDNNTVTRLRRVWDTWSTDYSYAPATGVNNATGQPVGPPFSRPLYPSYPPPYEAPLRGIQIQIRVVDPRNERVKVLTIRQDFSDKL